jgi:hypothetical protein
MCIITGYSSRRVSIRLDLLYHLGIHMWLSTAVDSLDEVTHMELRSEIRSQIFVFFQCQERGKASLLLRAREFPSRGTRPRNAITNLRHDEYHDPA